MSIPLGDPVRLALDGVALLLLLLAVALYACKVRTAPPLLACIAAGIFTAVFFTSPMFMGATA